MNENAQKREMTVETKQGLQIADLVLIAVLLAAGAVLKLVVGMLFQTGMKPNFIIASYCLAILLIKPRSVGQGATYGAIVGLLAAAVCQIPLLCAAPFLNFASELLGGIVIGILAALPLRVGKFDLRPSVGTFLATLVSGSIFAILAVMMKSMAPMAGFIQFAPIVLGTAAFNLIVVQILVVPLRKALNR